VLNGGDFLVAALKAQGVEGIFTLCGNGILSLYTACEKGKLRLIDFRNEQAAAYAADAYARLTRRVGVVAVSSGVAHSNALTGIANAYFDGAPILLFTGASPGYGGGKGVFQEFDQMALAEPLCKYADVVTCIEDLPFKVEKALATAMSGRPGPVHLTIPEDIFDTPLQQVKPHRVLEIPIMGGVDSQSIRECISLLQGAKRPLLIAGTTLFYADASATLLDFCEKASIPITVPIWDRGVIEGAHPNFVGVVGAASGQPSLLSDVDVIMVAGAWVDYRIGYLTPPSIRGDVQIIRIDIDPHLIHQGIYPTIGVVGDPSTIFTQLMEEIGDVDTTKWSQWLGEARRRWETFRTSMTGPPVEKGMMTGKEVVETIFSLLTDEVLFLIDGGNIGQWVHMLTDTYPGNWLTCGASAVVGWGLGGAIGAKCAFPSRPVLLLSGDGAFGFTLGELESAVRQGLPFVTVVAVDAGWGIVVSTQTQLFGEKGVIASRFSPDEGVRYDKVAQGLGAKGVYVETPENLRTAILSGFSEQVPTVIHVPLQLGGPADHTPLP
jgi:acetolactate synthase-1/2/3 large subunit